MGRLGLIVVALGVALQVGAEEPFDYFDNSWSVIGLKDYARGTRITPDNKLMIGASVNSSLRCRRVWRTSLMTGTC
jgi:hypothetical protein